MLCLPSSLNELLLLFATCFSRPTYRTFCALVVGQISQTRVRCVTGMLVGARLSGVWHHARAHRFFSHARWCADELGLKMAEVIVSRLLSPDQPLVVPIDDTLTKAPRTEGVRLLLASRRDRQQQQGIARVGHQLGHRRDQRQAAVP